MIKTVKPANISGSINAPSSKSYAQRAVAAALLAEGESILHDMELCSDTAAAIRVAEVLGAECSRESERTYMIRGGLKAPSTNIDIGESGLSARMFTPIAALLDTPVTISGSGTLSRRPMDMLIQPLRDLGIEVASENGLLPITVKGPIIGGETIVDGEVSSQFITGLLMALPLALNDTTFRVSKLSSIPYIDMTLDVLEQFGIECKHNDYIEFFVGGRQKYRAREYRIEGDWSGASCLLVAGAVAGEVTVYNLNPLSKQADIAVLDALERAGAHITISGKSVTVGRPEQIAAFEFDATHCPDLFPALAALAANCDGVSRIKGVQRLIHKESDRAAALIEEYGKLGVRIDIPEPDVMDIHGGEIRGAEVDSHTDHRIAMSLAVAALNADGQVRISGAESVEKSYPAFWNDLESILI